MLKKNIINDQNKRLKFATLNYILYLYASILPTLTMSYSVSGLYAQSDRALLALLGDYIQKTRLNQNKTQQVLADAAGINRSTLVLLEKGKSGTLLTFVQVIRALEHLHVLEQFQLRTELSPMQLAEIETKKRKRAGKKSAKSQPYKSPW